MSNVDFKAQTVWFPNVYLIHYCLIKYNHIWTNPNCDNYFMTDVIFRSMIVAAAAGFTHTWLTLSMESQRMSVDWQSIWFKFSRRPRSSIRGVSKQSPDARVVISWLLWEFLPLNKIIQIKHWANISICVLSTLFGATRLSFVITARIFVEEFHRGTSEFKPNMYTVPLCLAGVRQLTNLL